MDFNVTSFVTNMWIDFATLLATLRLGLKARQAYFVPRKNTDHRGSFNLEIEGCGQQPGGRPKFQVIAGPLLARARKPAP